ncbi:acyltransferase family protein [Pseudomonas sp. JUb96]|uniref:acyltransferase family protein n=1 Tax=Pseudomonas sp. JUb96 TaxID=2940539 RepID=UPI002227E9F1|nr:acyltransferase family protein [Pseudomonas sp. JUb96]MCW2271450.1 peptidoglycan/LPS O-acetylase OafA/YrhL [Pseudomonas sp. JUb96]
MTTGTQLRSDIQGLRAIAVLGVILFHVNKHWLPGGFIGVDVFFVISGFLITQIILRKKEDGTFSFVDFYMQRVRRIVPAYLMLLIVVTACMAFLLIPRDFNSFKESVKAALYFNSNGFFAVQNDYFAPAAHELPLLHTWSLAVEMQFYLLLPLVLVVTPKRLLVPALLFITVSLVAYSEFLLQQNFRQTVYFSLSARVPEFLLGSLAAIVSARRQLTNRASDVMAWLGAVLVGLSFILVSDGQNFPGLLALPACGGTALLLTTRYSTLNQLLSLAPLVFLGALSYSLYLWHWPILAAIRYFSGSYEIGAGAGLLFAVLTLACAWLSYRYVEAPFRGRISTPSTVTRLGALGCVSFAVLVAAGAVNAKLVAPLPVNLTRYAVDAEICHGKIVGDCIRGDKTSERTLLLLGDSHAAQLNYFADVVGNAIHARVKVITSSSCVTIPGFDVQRIIEGARQACLDQIVEGEKYTPAADGIIIAGMWQYQAPSDRFMAKLDQFLSGAAARNQQVLVLAQVPMLTSNPQRIYRVNSIGLGLTAALNKEWSAANSKVKNLVARHKNAAFLDLSADQFFSHVPVQGDTLIYQDTHHLNEVGSQRYGVVAVPFIKAFLERAYLSRVAAEAGSTLSHAD